MDAFGYESCRNWLDGDRDDARYQVNVPPIHTDSITILIKYISRNSTEAGAFVKKLQAILQCVGSSRASMNEASCGLARSCGNW